jgi:large subunit ribosomal protein L3
MRMAGRTGGDTITLKNVKVVAVDTENNTILVKGAVPGRKGTLLALKA